MAQPGGKGVPAEQSGTSGGAVTPPALSLPKGGGAIRGIGEKFSANPVTGTGSMAVPIATSPGRSGFGPQLALSYDSGAGNGPFGFGWSLSLPAITRKTDKGLPRYEDAEESDVFILSGAEDLVPVFEKDKNGDWVRDRQGRLVFEEKERDGYRVRQYRPRTEGLFARIERWTRLADGDVHWRSISKDNILTVYGRDPESRIADPADPQRVFSWLICETRDDRGNAVIYEFKPEDGAGVDLAQAHERNRGDRDDLRRQVNRHLKRIRYGNRVPLLDGSGKRPRILTKTEMESAGWMFEVIFDYGEHDANTPRPDDNGEWNCRNDAFSTYRPGFEVRTCRLCQRVLMFHHFPDEPGVGADCLVRSTDFTYSCEQNPADARNPIYSFLLSVTQSGYKRQDGGYLKRSLPPLEFGYSQPIVQDTVQEVDAQSLENLPIGLDGAVYQWTDLHGEGIPGILTEQAGAWFYKRNLSPIGERPVEFAPLECVAARPNLALAGGQAQFMDLAGDGQPDLVVLDGPVPGLYEHDEDEGWQPFRPFTARLNRNTRDPNLKFVDLDGDGRADVLIAEDDNFLWHASLAEEGFGPAHRVQQSLDEEKGPRLVFADGTQSIYLADLSGDGLADLVRIRNGEVCYWPNLGYCRFGAKVTMDDAPWFDSLDQFDQKRIRLADIDGSGTTDIIYLHRDGVRLYFNQSGNSWSAPQSLRAFPNVDDITAITPTDLLGNGTVCLVWSSPLAGDARRQMRYVDLMGGQKPHLLLKTTNNLGAETYVRYASSIEFYLRDKRDGKPWITRLPFPVHVVERVETYDRISRNRFVTRYAYHHGYFDGEEREFRGFGMVEQTDTEEIGTAEQVIPGDEPTNWDAASFVPPVLTRTWFHTGVYVGRDHISDFFAGLIDKQDPGEYYREPTWRDDDTEARKRLLPDTVLPAELTLQEEREACRALKGSMLRQEVYALDGTPKAEHPYTVAEQNFAIRCLQPRGENRHAVFFTHPNEAITYHYERNPADPRVAHTLTLEVDPFGNVLKQASIGYGRRQPDLALLQAGRDKQTQMLVTYTETRVTNSIDVGFTDDYRTPLPCETRTYELTGLKPENNAARFTFDEWARNDFALPASATEIAYEETADITTRQKRPIEHVRTFYRPDDLGQAQNDPLRLLLLGTVEPLALPGESYKLAFTPTLLTKVFRRDGQSLLPNPADVLRVDVPGGKVADRGGYVELDLPGHWWIPSGRTFYSPPTAKEPSQELAFARQHFFLPHRYRDPFGHETIVSYDSDPNHPSRNHNLLVVETRDPLDNVVTVRTADDSNQVAIRNDYRVLQPYWVTDPNGNRTRVAFDALGLVAGTALMGKAPPEPPEGDSLDNFDPNPTRKQLDDFMARPREPGPAPAESVASQVTRDLLANATTRIVYDLERFQRLGEPPFAATIARETHVNPPGNQPPSKLQVSFSYSDGFGREIQKKVQAEMGPVPRRAADGKIVVGPDGRPEMTADDFRPRWVGSGWTVFNNKGKPVRQFEPFFTDTHRFEFDVRIGVSPILFYDPVERVIATLHPNHTYEKVVFDPWQQATWDATDTVLDDPRTDADIRGYTAGYFDSLPPAPPAPPWQTWHAQRQGGALGTPEQDAAAKAAAHAGTPTTAYLDTLGRPFLTVAHNKVKCQDHALDGTEARFYTRVELDIEGNQRAVRDADTRAHDAQGNEITDELGRIVMLYEYDILGNRIHQQSMEAGKRWVLNDVAGKPIRTWDSRGFARRMTYDELRRPTGLYVTESGAERLAERTVYGEGQGSAANHRTRVYQVWDGAGIVTSVRYDFKGNLLESKRELLPDYKQAVDWQQNLLPSDGTFATSTTYDALNRPVSATTPDGSIYRPTFNEANLLDRIDVQLRGAPEATPFVANIDYNAKGQRELIEYACGAGLNNRGVTTRYKYDEDTFRLTHLKTTRPTGLNGLASQLFSDPAVVQDLYYAYDPVGNITRIEDQALKVIDYDSEHVEPVCSYWYDALYRLIQARGREHIGQTAFDFDPPDGDYRDYPFVGHRAHPNDLQALRNYTEQYEYDAVGNFEALRHLVSSGGWTRGYAYEEDSLIEPGPIEPGKYSSRLTRTALANGLNRTEDYTHDDHGNMTRMPHLAAMRWDFKDQLRQVDLGGGGTAYYVYDAGGQRVRKVIHRQNGTKQKERIYLGGLEIYREYNGSAGATLQLERETLHVRDNQQRIALVETQTVENESPVNEPVPLQRYQLGNHLGSSSVELTVDGALISYEEYHPYGTTAFQAGRSAAEVSLKRYRYTGKERDDENGLYYYGARYYASWLGRWTASDPEVVLTFMCEKRRMCDRGSASSTSHFPLATRGTIRDDTDVYSYARKNPTNLVDPLGTTPVTPELAQKHGFGVNPETGRLRMTIHLPSGETKTGTDMTKQQVPGIVPVEPGDKPGSSIGLSQLAGLAEKTLSTPLRLVFGDPIGSLGRLLVTGQSLVLDNDYSLRVFAALSTSAYGLYSGLTKLSKLPFALQFAKAFDYSPTISWARAIWQTRFPQWLHLRSTTGMLGGFIGSMGLRAGVLGWAKAVLADTARLVLTPQGASKLQSVGTALPIVAAVAAATVSVGLMGLSIRAAVKGSKTPIEVMDKAYGTHFGDIYGWLSGEHREAE